MHYISLLLLVSAVFFKPSSAFGQTQSATSTIDKINQQNKLVCGVSTGVAGFSEVDERGQFVGFDVDFCRAVASALLGDDAAVDYVALTSADRFDALSSGRVDVLFRNTTWTLSRDIERRIDFAAINFFDGQGFMVKSDSGIDTVADLENKTICVLIETTSDKNLTDYVQERNWTIERHYDEDLGVLTNAYLNGKCDALTTDSSALAGVRASLTDANAHTILAEQISKEPLALAVRQGDDELRDIVAWTVFAMITAEELGINQANVDEVLRTTINRAQRRLLGVIETGEDGQSSIGAKLNLKQNWAYTVISQVGNYADVFEHNLGPGTAVGLTRGLNALYNEGGLMYAPPLR